MKEKLVRLALPAIGRGLSAVVKLDGGARVEAGKWPDGSVFVMRVAPDGPGLVMRKEGERYVYRGAIFAGEPDVTIVFKSIDPLFRIVLGILSPVQAYIEHRVFVHGDLRLLVSLLTPIHKLLAYLLPGKLLGRLYHNKPETDCSKTRVLLSSLFGR